jgi:hypothetical protein
MAQIDLKKATIYIKDGYSGATGAKVGAVNNGAGYPAATTILTVDGFTAAVTIGDIVTIVGSKASDTNRLTRHTITAHTETTGATTSITISPGLSASVLDNAVITVQPHQLEVKIGTGNLTWTEKRNIEYVRDRGALDTVREGDEEPVEVKTDFTWEFLKADTGNPPSVEDAVKQRGEAVGWTSSSDDACEPYAVDIEIWYNPPCSGEKDEQMLLEDFRWEQLDHNLKDGQVSMSGKCNVTEANVTRVS